MSKSTTKKLKNTEKNTSRSTSNGVKLLIVTQVMDKNHPILGFFHRWVEEFAKHFEEVHVICLEKGFCELPANVQVYSLGKEKGVNRAKYVFYFYKYAGAVLFKVRPRYFFFHMGAVFTLIAAPLALLRRFLGTRFYWWKTHGHIGMREKLSLLFMDRVYTASAKSFPIETTKRRVIGHAIDINYFAPGNVAKRKDLLFVGRVMPVKHVEQVIEMYAALRKDTIAGNKLLIIGPLPDSQYEAKLRKLIEEHELEESVVFSGGLPSEQVADRLMQAKVLISPSATDSVDKVVLESMAAGTPVVTTTESFRDVLVSSGLFVEKNDVTSMVKATQTIMDMPINAHVALGKQLREHVVAAHDLQTLTERIFEEHD